MRRILSFLMALVFLAGVSVCIPSCGEAGETSSADETSAVAKNTVFTDEYFEGAVRICMSLEMGDYGGEEMEAVIEVLKQVPLEPTDRSIYSSIYPPESTSNNISDDASESKVIIGIPFFCCTYYADGSKKSFEFIDEHVAFSDDENYAVTTRDLCQRIVDAVGEKEGEDLYNVSHSEYFNDFFH